MVGKKGFEGELKVCSLGKIGTLETDHDVGVVRVSGSFLNKHARRNALLKIRVVDGHGRKSKSIIRIVRAATVGDRALREEEIALQYDDRLDLGINDIGTKHRFQIKRVNDWLGLPRFFLGHPSPLVRKEAIFALALMMIGALIGFALGRATF